MYSKGRIDLGKIVQITVEALRVLIASRAVLLVWAAVHRLVVVLGSYGGGGGWYSLQLTTLV